jgi:hypothetical protein
MPNGPNETIMNATEFPQPAIKAVGDWELDINVLPFVKDADGQWFDPMTEIMAEKFSSPLIVYQHGVEQGAKEIQGNPILLGEPVPGTLTKQSDGWHIRVILDKAVKLAKNIMDAAKQGLVAVSSGSIAHLARLEIGGKMHMYDKRRPGRIAVWPVAEISLWEMGNGNMQPANKFAYALPAMKAKYRDAGLQFPDVSEPTDGVLPEASSDAAKRARSKDIQAKARNHIKKINKILGE